MLKLTITSLLLLSHSTKTYVLNITRINSVFILSYSGPIQALPIQDKHSNPLFISGININQLQNSHSTQTTSLKLPPYGKYYLYLPTDVRTV